MLFRIAVNACWIALIVLYFAAVAARSARLLHHPLGVRLYRFVRGKMSRPHRMVWYVTLFLGSLTVWTASILLGVLVVNRTSHWQTIGAVLASMAAGYSTFMLWPRQPRVRWRWILPAGVSVNAIWLMASAFLWAPGWVTNHVAGLILATPVFLWFRSLKIRTAACLALALAIHDGIHVFCTGLMDRFMTPFTLTPFILYLPREPAWWPLSSVGYGDIVVPGILVVIAGRISARRDNARILWGTCVGVGLGFAIGLLLTFHMVGGFPLLTTLVPGGLLGYTMSIAWARVPVGSLAKQAASIQRPGTP